MDLGDLLKVTCHSDSCRGASGSFPHVPLSASSSSLGLPSQLTWLVRSLWTDHTLVRGAVGGSGLPGTSEERRREALACVVQAGQIFFHICFSSSLLPLFGWVIKAAGVCGWCKPVCVPGVCTECMCTECAHSCVGGHPCGRLELERPLLANQLSSESAPTELASESFLGLTRTKQKPQIGCAVSLGTLKYRWRRGCGNQGKGVVDSTPSFPLTPLPLKIARIKGGWSQRSPGTEEEAQTTAREQRCPQMRRPELGSRTSLWRSLVPPGFPVLQR